jgi:hypothetical protein
VTKRKTKTTATATDDAIRIDRALIDPGLLGAGFGDPKTWQLWSTALKGAFGISLNRAETEQFATIAGGRQPPAQRVKELWCVLGRRSGKSRVAAALAVYFAILSDHAGKLAAGEVGYVFVLAASKDQARTIKNYCEGFLRASPMLAASIEEVTAEEIRLRGGIVIVVHSANFRTVRGRTLLACVFDEISFWRSEESAQPDREVLSRGDAGAGDHGRHVGRDLLAVSAHRAVARQAPRLFRQGRRLRSGATGRIQNIQPDSGRRLHSACP